MSIADFTSGWFSATYDFLKGGPAKRRTLFVFHMPRTGGSTLRNNVLAARFAQDQRVSALILGNAVFPWAAAMEIPHFIRQSERVARSFDCVSGHMPFPPDVGVPEEACEVFIVLREPIDHAVSDYFYCRWRADHPAHDDAQRYDLVEFYERGCGSGPNSEARWLASSWFGGPIEDAAVRSRALRNLARTQHVAIYEEIDAAAAYLARLIGITNEIRLPVENGAPRTVPVGTAQRERLRALFAVDLELYSQARRRWQQCRATPPAPLFEAIDVDARARR